MTPSKPGDPSQGKPAADEQTELEATEAKQAAATEAAAESPEGEPEAQPKPRRRTRAKKAEGTAAEVTGEQKDAAEAAVHEGSAEPVDDADSEAGSADDEGAATQEQAPPPSRPRRRGADADRQAPAPAPTRRGKRPAGERVLVRATARYVRTSPRKARLVCDHIRGKSIQEARAILAHTPRAAARDWSKLLESAIANAEHNHELIGDDLRVFAVTADDGPTLKRFQPRAMGRATRIRKRTSHLTIMLTPKE